MLPWSLELTQWQQWPGWYRKVASTWPNTHCCKKKKKKETCKVTNNDLVGKLHLGQGPLTSLRCTEEATQGITSQLFQTAVICKCKRTERCTCWLAFIMYLNTIAQSVHAYSLVPQWSHPAFEMRHTCAQTVQISMQLGRGICSTCNGGSALSTCKRRAAPDFKCKTSAMVLDGWEVGSKSTSQLENTTVCLHKWQAYC